MGRCDGSFFSLITHQIGDPNDKQRNNGGGRTKRGIESWGGTKGAQLRVKETGKSFHTSS